MVGVRAWGTEGHSLEAFILNSRNFPVISVYNTYHIQNSTSLIPSC